MLKNCINQRVAILCIIFLRCTQLLAVILYIIMSTWSHRNSGNDHGHLTRNPWVNHGNTPISVMWPRNSSYSSVVISRIPVRPGCSKDELDEAIANGIKQLALEEPVGLTIPGRAHQGGKHERAFMNTRSASAHAYTCHSVATLLNADWLPSREIQVKVEIFQLKRVCRCTNPRERARLCTAKVWRDKSKLVTGFLSRRIRPIRVSTFTLYGISSPRLIWCERTVTVRLHQTRHLSPVRVVAEVSSCHKS